MAAEMPVEQARAKLGDLVIAAMSGQTTTLTRYGRPVARIVPILEPTMTTTYTRTDEQGTETIAITRTGDEVREVYTVDGQVLDDAIVAGPGSRDADTYLHERDVDLRADGWTA